MFRKGLFTSLLIVTLALGCGAFDRLDQSTAEGMTQVTVFGNNAGSQLNSSNQFFSISALTATSAGAVIGGGIMVYLKGLGTTAYELAFSAPDELTTQVVDIPNGEYQVYSFGYTAGMNIITSTGPRCGFTAESPLVLSGVPKDVLIDLNSSNCSQEPFKFTEVSFLVCPSAGLTAVTSYGSGCTKSVSPLSTIKSLRVIINLYETKADGFTTIKPFNPSTHIYACTDIDPVPANIPVSATLLLPLGKTVGSTLPDARFPISVEAMDQPCTTPNSVVIGTYEFRPDLGNSAGFQIRDQTGTLIAANVGDRKLYLQSGPTSPMRIYLRDFTVP